MKEQQQQTQTQRRRRRRSTSFRTIMPSSASIRHCLQIRFLINSLLSLLILCPSNATSSSPNQTKRNLNTSSSQSSICLSLHTIQTDRYISCLYTSRRRRRNRNNSTNKCHNSFRNGLQRISSTGDEGKCEKSIKADVIKGMVELCKKDKLEKVECESVVRYFVGVQMFGVEYVDMMMKEYMEGIEEEAERNAAPPAPDSTTAGDRADSTVVDEAQPIDNSENLYIYQPPPDTDNQQIAYQPVQPSDPLTPVLPLQSQEPPHCEDGFITKCFDTNYACCDISFCPPCVDSPSLPSTPPPLPPPPVETLAEYDRIFDTKSSRLSFLSNYRASVEYGHSISLGTNKLTVSPRFHAMQVGNSARQEATRKSSPVTVIFEQDEEEGWTNMEAPIYAESPLPVGKDNVGNLALLSRVDNDFMVVRYNRGIYDNETLQRNNVGVVQVYLYQENEDGEDTWELVGGIMNNGTNESIGHVAKADKAPFFITEVLCFDYNEDFQEVYNPGYPDGYYPYAPTDPTTGGGFNPYNTTTTGGAYSEPYDSNGQYSPIDINRPPENGPDEPHDPYGPGINGNPNPNGYNPDGSNYIPYDPSSNTTGAGGSGGGVGDGSSQTGSYSDYYSSVENGYDGYFGEYNRSRPPPEGGGENRNLQNKNDYIDRDRGITVTRKFRVHFIGRNGTIQQVGNDIQNERMMGTTSSNSSDFRSGISVGISYNGTTVAVGYRDSREKCNSVAVYQVSHEDVDHHAWVQVGRTIQLEDEYCTGDHTLALHFEGQYIAIGSTQRDGLVRVYRKGGRDWIPHGNGMHGRMNTLFGKSLSMNKKADRIVVGAPNHSGPIEGGRLAGQVQIFQYDAEKNVWRRDGVLYGEDNGQRFGFSVSMDLDGSRVAVGSTGNGGRAEVYQVVSR